jgi:hypothetical protein
MITNQVAGMQERGGPLTKQWPIKKRATQSTFSAYRQRLALLLSFL